MRKVILLLLWAAAYFFSSVPRTVVAIVTASPPISLASSIAAPMARCLIQRNPFTDRPAQMIDHREQQAIVEQIRQLRAEGNGLLKIAKHLDESKIPCRGTRWHASTVASILGRNGLSV
jgi:hypothetical protein